MQTNIIILEINLHERLYIEFSSDIDCIYSFDDAKIYYKNSFSKYKIELYNNYAVEAIDNIFYAIKALFDKKLTLHPSIKIDIGYLWDEHLQNKDQTKNIIIEKKDGLWVGLSHLVWSGDNNTTWVYKKDEKIILEITPTYKWHFTEPTEEELAEYITYDEYIKNYNSLVISEIKLSTIQEWYVDICKIRHLLEQNDRNQTAE